MNKPLPNGIIHVCDVSLWAHVGVLEDERRYGQWFSLDFSLKLDLEIAARDDNLDKTADYGVGIKNLQKLSFELSCLTIEHFSDQILFRLEEIYGCVPMRIRLKKCSAPLPGFNGSVSIERTRNCYY